MKIFGKRKKTSRDGEAISGNESPAKKQKDEKRTFASDPVVAQLLKKAPSEWNAKEKRMVKRYQARQEAKDPTGNDEVEEKTPQPSARQTSSEKADFPTEKPNKESGDNEDIESDDSSDSDSSSDDDSEDKSNNSPESENDNDDNDQQDRETPVASESKGGEDDHEEPVGLDLESVLDASLIKELNSKQRRKLSRSLAKDGAAAVKQVIEEANQIVHGTAKEASQKTSETQADTAASKMDATNDGDNDDDMARVKELLQSLNSKQKRKLSRRLEREGSSCLAEVKAEAEALLKGASSSEETKNDNTQSSTTTPQSVAGKKRKRRRGPADLSGLTPEERLRREEQRKMQKEAAERRANGEVDESFRHPLNSERRRANRRKPKWAPKKAFAKNADKIEHNASGFHVRKMKKTLA